MTPAVRAFVEALLAEIARLRAELAATRAARQAEIDELKAQVRKLTPRNSSVPPSTQHPHARPKPKPKPKSKRQRGGQKGHPRTVRELLPVAACDEVIPLHPEQCRRCGEGLSGDDPEPLRKQFVELPEIKPIVTEYQFHRRTCSISRAARPRP